MRFNLFVTTIALSIGVALSAAAIGERGHIEIGRMAVETYLQNDTMLPGLAALFGNDDNIRALYSGCALPDWGFGLGSEDVAEYTHWHPFMERYVALLRQRFPLPWDAEAQRQVCFFFGVIVHNISDIPWHFSEDNHNCFLKAGLDADGAGHGAIEFACDIFLYAERTLEPSVVTESWFPLDLLLDVYEGSGHKVTRAALEQGTMRSQAMFFGGGFVGALQLNTQKKNMPWVYDHYIDYYYGGLEHGAAVTAAAIRYYYARLTGNGFFQNTPPYAPYVRHAEGYVPRLQVSETHLMADQTEYNAGGEPLFEIGGSADHRRIGLIQVDLGEVAPDFDLGAAQLRLYCADLQGALPDTTMNLVAYRLLKPWQEGAGTTDDVAGANGRTALEAEACCSHTGTLPWTGAGCAAPDEDYMSTPVAATEFPVLQQEGNWIALDITSAATHWLAHPEDNYGLLLRLETEHENVPIAQFYSSQAFKGCPDGLCGGKRVAFRPALILLSR